VEEKDYNLIRKRPGRLRIPLRLRVHLVQAPEYKLLGGMLKAIQPTCISKALHVGVGHLERDIKRME
jgi:hypothetical protein